MLLNNNRNKLFECGNLGRRLVRNTTIQMRFVQEGLKLNDLKKLSKWQQLPSIAHSYILNTTCKRFQGSYK